jgi:pimeloyl-ACP methyl ester carboxylesterase
MNNPSMSADPIPLDFRAEVAAYENSAEVGIWAGPRYRMTHRSLGSGPPLILIPGIASTYRVYAPMLNRLARRFRTVQVEYPGENRDDGAQLRAITHDDIVTAVIGLADHLGLAQPFLFGLSFGSTVTLATLVREPARFPRAAIQGGFARRPLEFIERLGLALGRWVPGTLATLPLHTTSLAWKNRATFPANQPGRWEYYADQNGLTPIAAMARRLDLMGQLDLRAQLAQITTPTLLIQGELDPIVPRKYYDELLAGLPNARGVILPGVGHQPHFTHLEDQADLVSDFLLGA